MSTQIPQRLDADHRRFVVAREPHLLHCHHYNTFLLRSILDAHFVDSLPFLVGAGNEVAFHQLSALFKEADLQDVGARKELAAELYRWAGFGVLDLSTLTEEGGTLQTAHSHYSMAWNAKFGTADAPMDHFTAGWLSGALAAIYDRPQGQFAVRQTDDMAAGAALNRFTLEGNGDPNYTVFASPGLGPLTTHEPRPVPETPVDYDGIFAALSGMDISGDPQGVIPAFGVYLTRHYANYYNRISFEFLREMDAQFGEMGVEIAEPLLVEAGHVCAFNTFGGIMTSSEWDALIRPSLQSREDWVHGIVAAVNALGWGRWQVSEVSEAEATFVIHDDYESVGHLASYGEAHRPASYLAEGAAAGIMNLVYVGNVHDKPTFDEDFYQRLFKSEESYQIESVSSRATGDPVTTIRIHRA